MGKAWGVCIQKTLESGKPLSRGQRIDLNELSAYLEKKISTNFQNGTDNTNLYLISFEVEEHR
jgi:hypothetical protein